MKKNNNEGGNVILRSEEIADLRKAILEKYEERAGEEIKEPEKVLNSNLNNYKLLYDSIDEVASLSANGIRSTKPLAMVFHFSRISGEASHAFRKKFVNALYFYAFGRNRDDYVSSKANSNTSSNTGSQLKNLEGYWEYYYDKDAIFVENLQNNRDASLDVIAFTIKGENENNAVVEYYQPRGWGFGTIKIQRNNFIIQLKSEKDNDPTFQIMNCGGKYVEDFVGHVKYAAGISVYINDAGSVKSAKCLMVYYDANRVKEKYGVEDANLSDESFRKKFQSKFVVASDSINNKRQEKIRQFFEQGLNTTDVNVFDFSDVD